MQRHKNRFVFRQAFENINFSAVKENELKS
jgi:hypothetical protein